MEKFWKFLEESMANMTEFLTKVRSTSYIRNLQLSLVLITLTMVTYFLSHQYIGQEEFDLSPDGPFAIGSASPETIISNREIVYPDQKKTQIEKAKAYNSGAFIFDRDYSMLQNTVYSYIDEELENLKSVGSDPGYKTIANLLVKNPRWKNRSQEDLKFLIKYPRKQKLKELIKQCTSLIFSSNCILKEAPPNLTSIQAYGGKVYNKGGNDKYSILDGSHIFPRENIYKNHSTMKMLTRLIEEKFPKTEPNLIPVVKRLSLSYVYSIPACHYNESETEQEKLKEQEKVKPVSSKIEKNEKIIKKGELITPEIRRRLEHLNTYSSRTNISSILSVLIVQVIFVWIIAVFLKKYDSHKLNDLASNIILFSMIWLLIIFGYILSRFYFHPDSTMDDIYYFAIFCPIGMVCLLTGFIFDEELGIGLGLYLSIFIFLISLNNITSFVMAFSTTVVAAIYGFRIRKRLDFLKSGILISFVQMIVATSGYLLDSREYWISETTGSFFGDLFASNLFKVYLACFLNGFISATVAQILLPIYEYLFNIPTRFKLQELADTGHPLLQALLTKAPSTYTHTFMVSAMSERAAQNLGLDWLLVRTGVYFHDIGKIPNAGFFVENQHLIPKPENINKDNPGQAAKIVIDHVIDGIAMAKKARLPREIINFIPEHHGTSTMAFFYHTALANLSPNQRKKIKKEDFQYPGPKPQRKETAIVMIADSAEAASRSLEVITPESLDELIQKIINIKLAENQLDESGLTLGDLTIIKQSFKEILLSSLHQRPKYPNSEDTKKLESETKNPQKPPGKNENDSKDKEKQVKKSQNSKKKAVK
ncbi:MAG: HDIG domain-containing protein [Leptospiraceae bacterium]|nr:HDIG domain-containing protein [Leptospiraceae bacterium]